MKKSSIINPINFIASLAGSGFLPKAPGTWGSLFSLAIYLLLPAAWFELPAHFIFTGALLIICFFSVWISTLAEKNLGHDAPQIVIDEFCGFFVSVLFCLKASWWVSGLSSSSELSTSQNRFLWEKRKSCPAAGEWWQMTSLPASSLT